MSFKPDGRTCRIKSKTEVRAFDAEGVEHRFTPEVHVSHRFLLVFCRPNCRFKFAECEIRVCKFFKHIEASYRHNRPLHTIYPQKSHFDIIPFTTFQALSPSEVQSRLRQRHIVITNCPHPNLKFDADGFRTLSALDRQTSIQGN